MQPDEEHRRITHRCLEDIARFLIQVFELAFHEDHPEMGNPLLRWLDFRYRFIEPRPRHVRKPQDFDKSVPEPARTALNAFIKRVEAGVDLNPYQSKTLKRNDTSHQSKQQRTDGLWAEMGIHHVHLTETSVADDTKFSERSDWLLFMYVQHEEVTLIDVRPHSEKLLFHDVKLFEKLVQHCPEVRERCELVGVLPPSHPTHPSRQEIQALRRAGMSRATCFDGKFYVSPAGGLSSAAAPTLVNLRMMDAYKLTKIILEEARKPGSPFFQAVHLPGHNVIPQLVIKPDGTLAIFSHPAQVYMPFPVWGIYAQLQDIILPHWARKNVMTKPEEEEHSATQ